MHIYEDTALILIIGECYVMVEKTQRVVSYQVWISPKFPCHHQALQIYLKKVVF